MYGARPIRRWIQKNVMNTICEMLVKGEVGEGSTISIDATDHNKGLKYEVVKKTADPSRSVLVSAPEPLACPDEESDDSVMVTSLTKCLG